MESPRVAMHFYNLQFCKSEKSYFTESVSLLPYFFTIIHSFSNIFYNYILIALHLAAPVITVCHLYAWVFYYLEVKKAKAGQNGICGNSRWC
jgi:hypothetical protein